MNILNFRTLQTRATLETVFCIQPLNSVPVSWKKKYTYIPLSNDPTNTAANMNAMGILLPFQLKITIVRTHILRCTSHLPAQLLIVKSNITFSHHLTASFRRLLVTVFEASRTALHWLYLRSGVCI